MSEFFEGMRLLEDGVGEDVAEDGDDKSIPSVAEHNGVPGDTPPLFFGEETCRAKFTLKATGTIIHVCGRNITACSRHGHRLHRSTGNMGAVGIYDTISAGNNHLDGILTTFRTAKAASLQLQEQRAINIAQVQGIVGLSGSSSGDEWTLTAEDLDDGQASAPRGSTGVRFSDPLLMAGAGDADLQEVSKPNDDDSSYEETTTEELQRKVDLLQAQLDAVDYGRFTAPHEPTIPTAPHAPRTSPPTLPIQSHSRSRSRAPAAFLAPVRPQFGRVPQVAAPTPMPTNVSNVSAPGSTAPPRYFAAFGMDDKSGFFSSYAMAVASMGPDASVVEFDGFEPAMAAVCKWREHHRSVSTVSTPQTLAPVGLSNAGVATVAGDGLARRRALVPGDEGYFPPVELLGPDPDMKQDDKLYGLGLSTDMKLRTAMAPSDVDDSVAKDLANAMLDVVSLPGTSQNSFGDFGVEDHVSDMSMMGGVLKDTLEELTQDRQGRERVKTDNTWKSASHTTLRSLRSGDMLEPRLNELLKLRGKLTKTYIRRVTGILEDSGFTAQRANVWAVSGYHARLVTLSFEGYVSLHQYLVTLHNGRMGWPYIEAAVRYHTNKMGSIRSHAPSRLMAICELYTYLRDGQSVDWRVAELDGDRIRDMCREVVPKAAPVHVVPVYEHCAKCRTNKVHPGGKDMCYWKDQSDEQARAAGSAAQKNLNKRVG